MKRQRYINRTGLIDSASILTIFIALKPIYLAKSGGIQICDFVLVVGFLYFLIKNRNKIRLQYKNNGWIGNLLLYTIYVIVINSSWFAILVVNSGRSYIDLLFSSLYYIFNLLAVYVCFETAIDVGVKRTISAAMKGCFFSAVVAVSGVVIRAGTGLRNAGFFNNPNQLGFFSIIILTFLAFFKDYFSKREKWFVLIAGVYCSVVSLSKASAVSMFGLGLLYIIGDKRKRHNKKTIVRVILLLVLAFTVYVFLYGDLPFIRDNYILNELRNRILYMRYENDSNLGTGRGYDRVYEMGLNTLWGMGEGAYTRFITLSGLEVHSTYITIFISYGIFGSLLSVPCFIRPLYRRGNSISNICKFSGIALYCITHNGIRNTLVWVLMSMLILSSMRGELRDE